MHGIVKSKNLIKQVPVKFRQKKRLVDQIKREFQDEVYQKFLVKLPKTPVSKDEILVINGFCKSPKRISVPVEVYFIWKNIIFMLMNL